ncbi:hypothetical protein HanRHA438_Chr10g0433181 [Helianthus annuus]|uniref:Uncharacterized protein n=1 Tax=Helianthus annuus TaxID=4232 RepID=A0A9K3HUF9_HELAN|nr:hypothetical protein HanXRQr2_Chr10g0420751 [Helianthus annuus]KAJ0512424.1 hypothetical protein HanHA300_Chr10g0346111 [Helianthus annuus]KAJ0528540.1 hypothetical protein HanHA89_Chr10g0367551 [Helianthus annuus]KAJ0698922.1 hypothetical protein HanOQP8_Chr10g0350101 [Helianthus annuus]KAJ0877855.1 hypothetical protein HanRHA438_Chr10g0433181 [Helianthus annuus]
MGTATKEKSVLKLVHPGRHVEYHRRSITAGEIMKKNPRHSLTRPDFFKNPSTVVRPESVMVPGQVFFIVPNTTVHRLIKAKSQQHGQPSSQQTESRNTSDYRHHQEQEYLSSCGRSLPRDDTWDDSLTLTFQARDYYLNENRSAWAITTGYGQHETRNDKQDMHLKSCMKGGIGASLNPRVTFKS